MISELTKSFQNSLKTIESHQARIKELESQLKWFQKNVFGQKSERRVPEEMPTTSKQMSLLEVPTKPPTEVVVQKTEVAAHTRKKSIKQIHENDCGESGLRFGPEVRVEEVEVVNPATIGLTPEQYDVIDTRVQDKLCKEKSAKALQAAGN